MKKWILVWITKEATAMPCFLKKLRFARFLKKLRFATRHRSTACNDRVGRVDCHALRCKARNDRKRRFYTTPQVVG
ncbi:hypothetical protein NYJ85_06570 [Helicobacter sp. CPD2-1]|nr:hypothetical protein [Helicobacter sp. CPD2-1]